ncbi:uncharacterized protein MICPUCDRAFT_63596, partial [Micromonas pusilla CCMP1545]
MIHLQRVLVDPRALVLAASVVLPPVVFDLFAVVLEPDDESQIAPSRDAQPHPRHVERVAFDLERGLERALHEMLRVHHHAVAFVARRLFFARDEIVGTQLELAERLLLVADDFRELDDVLVRELWSVEMHEVVDVVKLWHAQTLWNVPRVVYVAAPPHAQRVHASREQRLAHLQPEVSLLLRDRSHDVLAAVARRARDYPRHDADTVRRLPHLAQPAPRRFFTGKPGGAWRCVVVGRPRTVRRGRNFSEGSTPVRHSHAHAHAPDDAFDRAAHRASPLEGPTLLPPRLRPAAGMSSSHHDARPPHSRLFVVCGRGVREDELESFFAAHGEIQSARVVEAKGVAYVKFALASCAARAVETLRDAGDGDGDGGDGGGEVGASCRAFLGGCERSLRVLVADDGGGNDRATAAAAAATNSGGGDGASVSERERGGGGDLALDPDDDPPRSRLFVVCPKGTTHDVVSGAFAELLRGFADPSEDADTVLTSVRVVPHKGVAFAKFARSSTALRCMEAVAASGTLGGVRVKCMLAERKSTTAAAMAAAAAATGGATPAGSNSSQHTPA